ncbi:MAG: hypothetical protein AAGB12_03850 [Pseudomonadota bacterium]
MGEFYITLSSMCFSFGVGIFLCILILEKPTFHIVNHHDGDHCVKNPDVSRVAFVLNQFAHHKIPVFMASQMLIGISCLVIYVGYYTHTIFHIIILSLSIFMLVIAGLFVPGAIKKLQSYQNSGEQASCLSPLYRVHLFGGIILAMNVSLLLINHYFTATSRLNNQWLFNGWFL